MLLAKSASALGVLHGGSVSSPVETPVSTTGVRMIVEHNMTLFYKHPLFSNTRFIMGVYAALALLASIKLVFFEGSGVYSIFYYSLSHLLEGKSLYAAYPAEYSDHYHYAPTFAALFAPIFALPYSVGLIHLATAVYGRLVLRHLPDAVHPSAKGICVLVLCAGVIYVARQQPDQSAYCRSFAVYVPEF